MEPNNKRILKAIEAKHRRRVAQFLRNIRISIYPVKEIPLTSSEKACANNGIVFGFCVLGACVLFFLAFFQLLPFQNYRLDASGLRQDAPGSIFLIETPTDPTDKAQANIKAKCGVLSSDEVLTTAMIKISNCIDQKDRAIEYCAQTTK